MFEDNEEVIRMILKGRSPYLRHVSRTCSVDFDRYVNESIETKQLSFDVCTPQNSWQIF